MLAVTLMPMAVGCGLIIFALVRSFQGLLGARPVAAMVLDRNDTRGVTVPLLLANDERKAYAAVGRAAISAYPGEIGWAFVVGGMLLGFERGRRCEPLFIPATKSVRHEPVHMARSSQPAKTIRNQRTVGNSRTTVSGPAEPDASGAGDIVAEKAAGTQEITSAFLFNPNRAPEYIPDVALAPREGASGQAVDEGNR
jgi:hypothetical protein